MQNKSLIRIISSALSITIIAGSVYCKDIWQEPPVFAWASSELESQKKENDAQISEMQKKLDELGKDQAEASEYQDTLAEKIELQEKNITIVDEQLTRIEGEISEIQEDITETEAKISDMESQIDVDLEEFKKRIRAMYISGNDSLASALVGATDFFDFLSKYDLISRIAKHDNDLVNGLKDSVTECNEQKAHLEEQKSELDVQLKEQQETKEELKTAILTLQDDFEQSVEYSDLLEKKQALLNSDIEGLEAANKELEEEDERILEAILEAQRKEEEEAAAATAAASKEQNQSYNPVTTKAPSNNNNNTGQQTVQTQKTTQAQKAAAQTTAKPVQTQAPVQTTVQTTTQTTAAPVSNSRFGWPCPGFYTLTSGFGPRWGTHHSGIDISSSGITGASVVASMSGTVILASATCSHNYGKSSSCGCGGGYGNYVIIQHDDGTYSTLYAHMSSITVSQGQYVSQGQTIGYVGSTGWSTGAHLHFEVRVNGNRVDPEEYLY